jgi:hypothetical protein
MSEKNDKKPFRGAHDAQTTAHLRESLVQKWGTTQHIAEALANAQETGNAPASQGTPAATPAASSQSPSNAAQPSEKRGNNAACRQDHRIF